MEFDQFDMIMRVNARGMALVSEAFLGNIKSGEQKKIITMTSTLGSLTNPTAGLSAMWYGASKAAVNKLNVAIAETLRSDGIIVVPMHPGSVRVEKQADVDTSVNPGILETEDSVRQMIATIAALELGDSGKILRYDGEALAW